MKKQLLTLSLLLFSLITFAQSTTLVINEVDYDIPGTDTTEFIEIKNIGSISINLSGYAIILHNGATNLNYDTIYLDQFILAPNQYYVVCGSGNYVPNCNQQVSALSDFIQNGSTGPTNPDGMALWIVGTSTIVDAFSYEGNCIAPFTEGTGVTVANADNNTANMLGLSRVPDGTDSNVNSTDFRKACITPGLANATTSADCDGIPTGINSTSIDKNTVYPNPADNRVNIRLSSTNITEAIVSVYDFTGKLVEATEVKVNNGIIQYNTAQFAEGVYILNVKSDNISITKKLTVLHR